MVYKKKQHAIFNLAGLGWIAGIIICVLCGFKKSHYLGFYFYRVSGPYLSKNRLDYEYSCDPYADCYLAASVYCSGEWGQSLYPSCGDHPSATATLITATLITGIYNSSF
jgi:hypothetical protein